MLCQKPDRPQKEGNMQLAFGGEFIESDHDLQKYDFS